MQEQQYQSVHISIEDYSQIVHLSYKILLMQHT
jgi:hypothetical protein